MANWLDKFQTGSFRGVEFFIESHDFGGGRRKVDHEFPERNEGRSEDLGKAIAKFSLSVYVLGDDYFAKRNRLLDALETKGSGELVHPYFGRKVVQVGAVSIRETAKEGRIARFTFECTETRDPRFPDSADDNIQNTIDGADNLLTQSINFFESIFSVANQAAHVVDGATQNIDDAMDFMEDSIKKFTSPIANLTFAIRKLKGASAALSRLPGQLAQRVSDVFNDLFDAFSDNPEAAQLILGNFATLLFQPVNVTTQSRSKQAVNQAAVQNLFKQQAHSFEAKAAVAIAYTNVAQAIRVRDSVVEQLDLQLEVEDLGDDLFQAIKDLVSPLVKALPPLNIGTIIEIVPTKTTPAIVIAYNLYQDLDREQEIIDQNNVSHPGFVPGGVAIEVASA